MLCSAGLNTRFNAIDSTGVCVSVLYSSKLNETNYSNLSVIVITLKFFSLFSSIIAPQLEYWAFEPTISQLRFSVCIYTWLALCCCRVRKLLGDCSVRRDKADHNRCMKSINAEDSCFVQYVAASLVEWFSSFQRSGSCHLLKYWELWDQLHSITSRKTWIVRTTPVRSPNLAWVVVILSVFKLLVLYLRGWVVVSCHLFS